MTPIVSCHPAHARSHRSLFLLASVSLALFAPPPRSQQEAAPSHPLHGFTPPTCSHLSQNFFSLFLQDPSSHMLDPVFLHDFCYAPITIRHNGHYVTRQNIPYGEILEKYKEFSSRDYDPEITIMCFDTRVSTQ